MANDLTQAEIAGRIFKTAEKRPVKGELLRDFELTSTKGRKISSSDYRGLANLVLVFADASTGSLDFLCPTETANVQDSQKRTSRFAAQIGVRLATQPRGAWFLAQAPH